MGDFIYRYVYVISLKDEHINDVMDFSMGLVHKERDRCTIEPKSLFRDLANEIGVDLLFLPYN